jgi:hypothetical protein
VHLPKRCMHLDWMQKLSTTNASVFMSKKIVRAIRSLSLEKNDYTCKFAINLRVCKTFHVFLQS